MPCQQLGYDHPWTPGVAQGYEADQLYTSGLPEMSGHQFDFPGVSPSHHNMTRANPEVTSLIGCKDLFDWVCDSCEYFKSLKPDRLI